MSKFCLNRFGSNVNVSYCRKGDYSFQLLYVMLIQAFLRISCSKSNLDHSFLFTSRNDQLLSLELVCMLLRITNA